MFGYMRVYDPELRLRELDCYRGVYCGLCRAQGKCTGQCSRLMLSYDFAFMALVRMALTDETVTLSLRRCPVHPLKRRPMADETPALRLTALSASLLAWHKLEDDKQDERGGRRLRAALATPVAGAAKRRALRSRLPEHDPNDLDQTTDGARLDALIAESMQSLSRLEGERLMSVDAPAQLFGDLLGGLLSYGLTGGRARIAQQIGLHTGRWIYILDAADDYEEDVKRGRYNPLYCLYRQEDATLSEGHREELRLALGQESAAIADALDLLDIRDRNAEGVIRNVVTEGMPHTVKRTLFPQKN